MLFEPQHYGSPISEELSEYLKQNITNNDIAIASTKTNISMSTLKYVMYRTNALSEANSVGIIELVRMAIKNCHTTIEKSIKAKTFFEKLMGLIAA